jgi:hypothetical protein
MTVVIRWFAWIIVPVAVAVALPVTLSSASGDYYHQMTMDDGTRMEFRLLAPELKLSSYPFLLALTQGAQTRDEVDWEWRNLYRDQTERRVWVVVSPVAPTGHSFHRGGYKYIPELLRRLSERYRPEGGKYYLAGVSNGGLAAFSLAFEHPELFHAMAVFPGWPSRRLLAGLDRLAELPIKIWAGETEERTRWELIQEAVAILRAADGTIELEIRQGEGHLLKSMVGGQEIFEYFDIHRPIH